MLRVETDRRGIYEAHIRKADGTEVEVAVNRQFKVTAVEAHEAGRGGHGGPGGRGHADLAEVATKLGVSESKLEAAVEAARPERGDRAAALAKALGVKTSAVEKILDANRPEGAGPERGARPDQSELVAALAKGLSIDSAKVRTALEKAEAAHRAEHEAERTVMYAAIAKAVDKTPAQVKAAFDAVRPARPTR